MISLEARNEEEQPGTEWLEDLRQDEVREQAEEMRAGRLDHVLGICNVCLQPIKYDAGQELWLCKCG